MKNIILILSILVFLGFVGCYSVPPDRNLTDYETRDYQRCYVYSNPIGASFKITEVNGIISTGNDSWSTPISASFSLGSNYKIQFSKAGYTSQIIDYQGGSGDIFVKLVP